MKNHPNRRRFIKNTLALSGLALVTPQSVVLGANDRFRVAICGVNSFGNHLMRRFADQAKVDIAWIIEPDSNVRRRRVAEAKELTGKRPKESSDLRNALDDPDVDAIVVATPNHWHALMVIWSAQAGKHCYVEKPASHDVYEGRVALEAARKYGVVVQHGTQRRSAPEKARLIKAIHSGKYGKLKIAQGFACRVRQGIGHANVEAPPGNLDWNLWRGPALVEFHSNLVHYNWHWFWATGNGDLNNQGAHQLDMAYWALDPDMHGQHPEKVMSLGGRFVWEDQAQTPNTQFGVAEYSNGQKVMMTVRNVGYDGFRQQVENQFHFEDGGRIVGDEYIAADGSHQPVEGEASDIRPGGEVASFIAACRENTPEKVNGSMVDGHYASALGHLMNISYRIGKPHPFNGKAVRFGDDSKLADAFLETHQIMRDGVGLPKDNSTYQVGPWLQFDSKTERFTGPNAANANVLLRNPRHKEFDLPDKV